MPVKYGSIPFAEQSKLFRNKLDIPTERWNDLQRDGHDTGFMVAGAMKADLLADLHGAIQKGIDQGTTLDEFRADFKDIVAKHGWTGWKGSDTEKGIAWRTKLIYETNLRSSYQAGRWQQQQAGKGYRPYLQYHHSHASVNPRAEHLSWNGLVLAIDDPWWKDHYPQNGYGCKCTVYALSARDLARMGKTAPDPTPNDGTYDWTDPKTGEVHTFPNGVQPFWDYTPGASLVTQAVEQLSRKLPGVPALIGAELMSSLQPLVQAEIDRRFSRWVDEVIAVKNSRNQVRLIGWITPEIVHQLNKHNIAPQSAGLFVEDRLLAGKKAARHVIDGDALNTEEWKSLPYALMHDAEAYLDNDTGKILYALPSQDAQSIKIVVQMDFLHSKKDRALINLARAAYKLNANALLDTRRYTRLN